MRSLMLKRLNLFVFIIPILVLLFSYHALRYSYEVTHLGHILTSDLKCKPSANCACAILLIDGLAAICGLPLVV